MRNGVELRLLGQLEVCGPGGPVTLGAAKERLLLAVLAVDRGRSVSRDRLIDELYGDHQPRSGVNAVQNYVLRLRRALGATAGLRILTVPGGYRLEAAADRVDADRAERLVAEGRAAAVSGDLDGAATALRSAIGLWRGPALCEFAERPFAEAEARRIDELCECAREDLVDLELAGGGHRRVCGELRVMVAQAPLRERRWAQLMLALHRDGRQADALEAFHACRATLAAELGIAPGPALNELHARILGHDPVLLAEPGPRGRPAGVARFVGRDSELRRLLDRMYTAAAGCGGLATIVGEPGIGKTRLLREFSDAAARRGATVLRGRCLEGEWQPAFHAFAEAVTGHFGTLSGERAGSAAGPFGEPLARLSPELPVPLGTPDAASPARRQPDEERMWLIDGVARFVGGLADHAPVVLALDDLHWADASTLVLLRHLARVVADRRVLIVAAYRADEIGPGLLDVLGAVRTDLDVSSVRLRGLDLPALSAVLDDVAAAPVSAELSSAILTETRGNPFFAREVVRHLAEEGALRAAVDGSLRTDTFPGVVPDGVRQVLARRRARLSTSCASFLAHAAAFDGPFPFAPVVAAAGLGEAAGLAAVDAVLAAGLVEPAAAPERYQFCHALIRHAVLAEVNPSRRLRMHRRLAEALAAARSGSSDVTAAEVAAQYHAGRDLPGAEAGVGAALEAAVRADAAAAHDETATFLAMAVDLVPAGDERVPALVARLGAAQAWAGRFDDAVTTAARAADLLASTDGPERAAAYLATVTSALASADGAPHAWRLAAQGLRFAATRRDHVWASLMVHELDRREADDPDAPGTTMDVPERREALRILLADGVTGRPDLARMAVPATYRRRDLIPDDVANDPIVRLLVLGDIAVALPLLTDAAEAARERGQIALRSYYLTLAARAQITLGDLAGGRATLAGARAVGGADRRGWGWQRIHDIGTLDALAHATDVGWTDVLTQLDEAYGAGNKAGHRLEASAIACGAKAAARLGRLDDALRRYRAVLPAIERAPAWAMNYLRTLCDAVETLWIVHGPGRSGHPDLPVLEEALRGKALAADFRFPMMDARLALGRVCALDGRYDEAMRWFAEAGTVLAEQGARPLRAIIDLDASRVAARAGDPRCARELRGAAEHAFSALGMIGWTRRAARAPDRAPLSR
ncbi:transcriptional regulator [Pseudonocardia hierapolitana]|uniref:Transcriptional regulator n=1 Tax=Pseudonocardia hierapolitana TaxID=1128676 RepID=A0A561T559_9PSEU|nr:AfsR/SARP family transcriptional regulator [Pseudonocardia hierapolitana]TWF82242.1 transcriptional regulator [Pseudonocardia hierapolitana]